ncbi:unnamed protein product [Calypogeia fissa]
MRRGRRGGEGVGVQLEAATSGAERKGFELCMALRPSVRALLDSAAGKGIVAKFLSAKEARFVTKQKEFKAGSTVVAASLAVERIAGVRLVAGRHIHAAMLAMDSSSQLLLRGSNDSSSSVESRRSIIPSVHGNSMESSGDSHSGAVEVEFRVDDHDDRQLHERFSPSPALGPPEANGRNGDFFSDQFVHSAGGEELDLVEELHNTLDPERDFLERSACQTAAGRALWSHVIHDPLAEVLAGKTFMRNIREKLMKDRANKSRELAGVMLAVRTLWFDSLLDSAIRRFPSRPQVVLLGAGMDTRVYRLKSLEGCSVFEVDFAKILDLKDAILDVVEKAGRVLPSLHAKQVERVAADVSQKDWFQRLEQSGFNPRLYTVWILEGLLYYLQDEQAKSLLEVISSNCKKDSVLLADFMNESSTHLGKDLKTKFYFHSDWPEELLPHLGYSTVKISQIGDMDANFGLVQDELHIFNQIRKVPRHVMKDDAGRPYHRLLLVETTVA